MKKFILFIMLVCLNLILQANPVYLQNSTASIISEYQTIKANQSFWVALKIQSNRGWHVYWKNPGDSGMAPQIQWVLPKGFRASKIKWLPPKQINTAHLVNYGYEGNAYFLVKMHVQDTVKFGDKTLIAKANWLICKEDCVPESASIRLKLNVGDKLELAQTGSEVSGALDRLSAILNLEGHASFNDKKISLRFPRNKLSRGKINSVYFYPDEEGYIAPSSEQKWSDEKENLALRLTRDFATPGKYVKGLLEVEQSEGTDYYNVKAKVDLNISTPGTDYSIVMILLMAFLGGFILNAMPCVFPVLSLKALAVAKKASSKPKHVRFHGLCYTAGVVISFLLLASVLVLLKHAGSSIGWGYQLQSPSFVTMLIMILFLVGLNLSGLFEVQWMYAGGQAADRTDWIGSFMTGVLATLVATPCTAPFMATAVGYALTQTGWHTFAVFLSLGLGLSSPFLAISFFPALIKRLPKPGQWMITMREVLAFPIYLTCVWLVWVLAHQVSHNEVATVLASLVFMIMLVWSESLFQVKGTLKHWFVRCVLILLILFPYYCFNTMGLDVKEEPYSAERLQSLLSQHRPVFVHATAAWCITCKTNELLVLSKHDVQQALSAEGITVLKADWTNQDAEITKFLEKYDRSGVPLYVFYSKRGESTVLPQILTKRIVLEAIKRE